MKLKAHLVKAFTRNKDEGNPAGVLLDAENLSDNQMISIAAELGFSESAFVQKSTCIIEQGYIMHKPGRMYVEMSNEVKVGGYAVSFGTRNIVI